MRVGIRAKQVAGVAAIVGLTVAGLSAVHLARLVPITLEESRAQADLLAQTVFHRAREVVRTGPDPYGALRADPGLRAILESTIYAGGVTGAAIVDPTGRIVAASDPLQEGQTLEPQADLAALLDEGTLEQLRVVFARDGQTLEVRQAMTLGSEAFGTIHIGISTLLMRQALSAALAPELATAAALLLVAMLVAAVLAGRLLRPIHVLRSGLSRLGRGELGVVLDLQSQDEFGDIGNSFNELSRQVSAGQEGPSPSRVQATLGRLTAGLAHEVKNPLNAMAIHLELLRTKIRGSATQAARPQPVAATGGTLGLAAGAAPARLPEPLEGALQHAGVIESELRRLDEVLQGFVKFARPEELHPRPLQLSSLVGDLVPVIEPDARAHGVKVQVDCPPALWIRGDEITLGQVLLNLALNACHAMPDGGTLRIAGQRAPGNRVEVQVEDTGVGIPPEQLGRIFDLYFSTKEKGSGLGLSMVYRIVQLHDGEIDVESTPGKGTTFRVRLPAAEAS